MAPKNKPAAQKITKPGTGGPTEKKVLGMGFPDMLPVLICILYFAVHFIPDFGAYDAMGPQWLYLVSLDIVVTLFVIAQKNKYQAAAASIFRNLFSKLYLAFFLLAGISIFTAINPTESWVCYVRLIATLVAFFNIGILLHDRLSIFPVLAQVLGLVLLIESCQAISQFLKEVQYTDLSSVILGLKGTAGNKNIFAASTIVKIPFVLYCIHRFKLPGKIVNIIILLLGVLTIFLVNARASYLSLIIIILLYLIYCGIAFWRDKKMETVLFRTGAVLIPVLAAFFISQVEISSVKSLQDQKGGYGTVTERLGSAAAFNAEDNQVRIRLWKHAIDYTSKHPLMGCGYGNWKIASIPYQRILTNDLVVPVHSHNDFVEQFAEMGILGGLLYLGLFFCIALFTLKTFRSKASDTIKDISFFSFLAFLGYSVDAFFNFPMERPINQVFFVFITAININAYLAGRKQEGNESIVLTARQIMLKPVFGFVSLLLLVPAFYVTYLTYQSLVVQRTMLQDLTNEPLKLNWKELFPTIPSIPNLCATGQPIDGIKGRYLSEAKLYDEALVLLDKGYKANPVIGYSEFLKAGLYFHQGKYDSAFRNGMIAYHLRPRADTYYQTLIAILAKRGDTVTIKKTFEEYNTYRPSVFGWNLYLLGTLNAKGGNGDPHLLALADSSLRLFKDDPKIALLQTRRAEILNNLRAVNTGNTAPIDYALSQKYYNEAITFFGSGNPQKDDLAKAAALFLKAVSVNPGNYVAFENAGICYINMKEWKKALGCFDKELALGLSTNGKPEYFRGAALINLGQKDQGCTSLHIASKKGWKEADAVIQSTCK